MLSLPSLVEREFGSLLPHVYFDTAGRSLQPKSVSAIGHQSLQAKETPWAGLPGDVNDTLKMKQLFSSLIDANTEDISLAPSTGFAMTMAARNIQRLGLLRKNELVVVLEKEMGSVIYPWQTICEETQASLFVVPFEQDTVQHSWTTQILRAIDLTEDQNQDIAVVSIPHVHWCDGTYIDFDVINLRLDQYAAHHRYKSPEDLGRRPLLVVDGTQSIGALPFSIKDIRPDFVACSVHKWLLSPYGMSMVYIHPKHRAQWLPLDLHERGRLHSDKPEWDEIIYFTDASGFPKEFFDDGRKFDSGGRPNSILVPMITRALEIVHEISPRRVQVHTRALAETLTSELLVLKSILQLIPDNQRAGHIVGLKLTAYAVSLGFHLGEIVERLKEHHVHVSIRGERMRVALYIYNSMADIYKFASLLIQIVNEIKVQKLSPTTQYRKILITGANGWLAQFVFQNILKSVSSTIEHESIVRVYASYSDPNIIPHWILKENSILMDFVSETTDDHSVSNILKRIQPDVIIHLAAISSPLRCHKDPALAMSVNCPQGFIQAIKEISPNSLFIYSSTDMVYDGEHQPYTVNGFQGSLHFDPVNMYGISKRSFEEQVLTLKNSVCLRLSNMLGRKYIFQPAGEKFLQFLWNCYQSRKFIGLKEDEMRSFVYVEDVNLIITRIIASFFSLDQCEYLRIVEGDRIFNIGGPRGLSRLQLAQILTSKLNTSLLVVEENPVMSESNLSIQNVCDDKDVWKVYALHSPVELTRSSELRSPRDLTMDVNKTERILNMKFLDVEDFIVDCLELSP